MNPPERSKVCAPDVVDYRSELVFQLCELTTYELLKVISVKLRIIDVFQGIVQLLKPQPEIPFEIIDGLVFLIRLLLDLRENLV